MNETSSKDLPLLLLVLLELPLDETTACLVISHELDLLYDLELLDSQLGLKVLGQLQEGLFYCRAGLAVLPRIVRQKFHARSLRPVHV